MATVGATPGSPTAAAGPFQKKDFSMYHQQIRRGTQALRQPGQSFSDLDSPNKSRRHKKKAKNSQSQNPSTSILITSTATNDASRSQSAPPGASPPPPPLSGRHPSYGGYGDSPAKRQAHLSDDAGQDIIIAPEGRSCAGGVLYNGCIYVFGGCADPNTVTGNTLRNDIFYFNISTKQWRHATCSGYFPLPRKNHSVTMKDHKLVIYGGVGEDGSILNDMFAVSLREAHIWKKVAIRVSPEVLARTTGGAVRPAGGTNPPAGGGANSPSAGGPLRPSPSLSNAPLAAVAAAAASPFGPSTTAFTPALCCHSAVIHPIRNSMVVYGGKSVDSISNYLYEFFFSTQEWTCLGNKRFGLMSEDAAMPEGAMAQGPLLYDHSAVIHNNTMLVYGGFTYHMGDHRCPNLNVFSFDFGSSLWRTVVRSTSLPTSLKLPLFHVFDRAAQTFVRHHHDAAFSATLATSASSDAPIEWEAMDLPATTAQKSSSQTPIMIPNGKPNEESSTATTTTTTMECLPPVRKFPLSLMGPSKDVFLFGGEQLAVPKNTTNNNKDATTRHYLNDLYAFSLDSMQWTCVSSYLGSVPAPTTTATSVPKPVTPRESRSTSGGGGRNHKVSPLEYQAQQERINDETHRMLLQQQAVLSGERREGSSPTAWASPSPEPSAVSPPPDPQPLLPTKSPFDPHKRVVYRMTTYLQKRNPGSESGGEPRVPVWQRSLYPKKPDQPPDWAMLHNNWAAEEKGNGLVVGTKQQRTTTKATKGTAPEEKSTTLDSKMLSAATITSVAAPVDPAAQDLSTSIGRQRVQQLLTLQNQLRSGKYPKSGPDSLTVLTKTNSSTQAILHSLLHEKYQFDKQKDELTAQTPEIKFEALTYEKLLDQVIAEYLTKTDEIRARGSTSPSKKSPQKASTSTSTSSPNSAKLIAKHKQLLEAAAKSAEETKETTQAKSSSPKKGDAKPKPKIEAPPVAEIDKKFYADVPPPKGSKSPPKVAAERVEEKSPTSKKKVGGKKQSPMKAAAERRPEGSSKQTSTKSGDAVVAAGTPTGPQILHLKIVSASNLPSQNDGANYFVEICWMDRSTAAKTTPKAEPVWEEDFWIEMPSTVPHLCLRISSSEASPNAKILQLSEAELQTTDRPLGVHAANPQVMELPINTESGAEQKSQLSISTEWLLQVGDDKPVVKAPADLVSPPPSTLTTAATQQLPEEPPNEKAVAAGTSGV